MQKFDLEDRTLQFAKNIANLCNSLPKNIINNEYIKQLIRSSSSIGANYREANDPLGKKDFVYRVKISLKEAKETLYWLELLAEVNQTRTNDICKLSKESLELKKIFSAIASKCK